MAFDPINIGADPDDGTGDAAIVVGEKLNAMLQELYAGVPHTRLDVSNALLTASFRDDGAGNLGWYVGAAGAVDGSQVKVATIDKATGNVGLGTNTPQSRLHIVGNQRFDIGASRSIAQVASVNHAAGNVGSVRLGIQDGSGISGVEVFNTHNGTYSSQDIRFSTAEGGISPTTERMRIDKDGVVRPGSDNTQSLGAASFRWSVVYAGTGTINTSDAREKLTLDGEDITAATDWSTTPPTEAELRVSRRLAGALGWFKFKDAVASKGIEGARRHFGLTVQFALQVCADEGVDPWAIGIFCRNEITRKVKKPQTFLEQKTGPADPILVIEVIDGTPTQILRAQPSRPVFEMRPVIDIDGNPVTVKGKALLHPVPVMVEVEREVEIEEPAGARLGFRPDQLALFLLSGLAAEA